MFGHESILEQLRAQGFNPNALEFAGANVQLGWTPSAPEPIVDSNRVLVAIPDMHLGDGGNADVFRATASPPNLFHLRLVKFLQGLQQAKTQLESQGGLLSVVQLGDFYDVWRAYPFSDDERGRTYYDINQAYGDCISLLIDDLDCRFCVGNHDAIMAQYPPDWAFAAGARLAYSQRFCQGRVFCFHGHQGDSIADQTVGQDGKNWVALGSVLSSVANPSGMALQRAIDAARDSQMSADGGWVTGLPPNDEQFSAPRWSDYDGKPARFKKLIDGLGESTPSIADAIRLVIVGHTHRPGVSWLQRSNRTIPIIDVGSWTYGRSQFAIVTEGSAAVYQL